MERKEYGVLVRINGRLITKLLIDSHYKVKHGTSVTDEIIIRLVGKLHGQDFQPKKIGLNGFEYYSEDAMKLDGKTYKLVWLFEMDEKYIGVVNCYRRD